MSIERIRTLAGAVVLPDTSRLMVAAGSMLVRISHSGEMHIDPGVARRSSPSSYGGGFVRPSPTFAFLNGKRALSVAPVL